MLSIHPCAQAVLNYLYYSGALENAYLRVELQPRGTGLVNTLGDYKGHPRATEFVRAHIRDGVVLNNYGLPSPCVHQYDRLSRSFDIAKERRDFGDMAFSKFHTKEQQQQLLARASAISMANFTGFALLPVPELSFKSLSDSRNAGAG